MIRGKSRGAQAMHLSRIVSHACLLLWVLLVVKPSRSEEARLVRSNIVCENDIWNRACSGDTVLSIEIVDYKVVTVSYICSRNNSVLGEDCPADSRTPVTDMVKRFCNGKKQCNLPAEKSIFGEPCLGTKTTASIYLEIFYACVDPPTTTPRPTTNPQPDTEPEGPSSREPISSAAINATLAPPKSSSSIKNASLERNVSVEQLSAPTTTKYRRPRPCTTSPSREIISFDPNSQVMNAAGSSVQRAQLVFWAALLLASVQFLMYH